MKICYISSVRSSHAAKWSEYFVKRGHQVHLISVHGPALDGATLEMPKVIPHYFPQFSSQKLRLAFTFLFGGILTRRIVNRIKPDVLHAIELSEGFCGALSGFHPFVMTPIGSELLVYARKYLIVRLVSRYIFRKADVVTINSVPLKEASIALGATEDRSYMIQWGVDFTQFNPQVDRGRVRDKYGLGNSPLILSPRGFRTLMNIETIIRCIPEVLREVPSAKFMFVYAFGNIEVKMKKLAVDLGISDSIIFVGHVDYKEMPYYCTAADVCVSVPSSDSSPRSVYEAMACGIPPVISNLSWTKDFITPEQNAVLVPARDYQALAAAILRLLRDKELRERIKEANLKLVDERVDYHKHMATMESIYQSLCRVN